MSLFADYDIEEIIAESEGTTVYKCIQSASQNPVMIKLLSQKRVAQFPNIVDDFVQILPLIRRLRHPNIIPVIDFGTAGGVPYLVMPFFGGANLEKTLKNQQISFEQRLAIATQICKGLAYAHRNGVVHSKIQPSNILVDYNLNIHISDIGVASVLAKYTASSESGERSRYAAPEQNAVVKALSPSCDVYSLGVVLYELFSGHLPPDPYVPPSISNTAVPAYLDEIISECLQADPLHRFTNAEEVTGKLLEAMWGAHIDQNEKQALLKGVEDIKARFAMLDVIRQTDFSSVYMCENTVNRSVLTVKKINEGVEGYDETIVVNSFQHPNIASVFGTARTENGFIIIMEYFEKGSLAERMVNNWDWPAATKVIRDVCQGLAHAGKNNLVHGNLRPSNIFFSINDQVKVSDFGLREHYLGNPGQANWYTYANESKSLLGDMLSMGAILFEMLTGKTPAWKRGELVVDSQFHALPNKLQSILLRLLAPVAKDRYRSFGDVISELDELSREAAKRKTGRPGKTSDSRRLKVLVFLLVLTLLMAIVYHL